MEWETESARMASVYQCSYITIAATAALSGEEGCLHPKENSMKFPYTVTQEEGIGARKRRTTRSRTAYVRVVPDASILRQAPLNQRAWVLQEMLLSRRIIHFTENQIYWSCLQGTFSEDRTDSSSHPEGWSHVGDILGPVASMRLHGPRLAPSDNEWWDLIKDYSARLLTKQCDKLAALAGVTVAFQEKTGATPLAGLWEDDLLYGLLWVSTGGTSTRPTVLATNIPTWSWASVSGQIEGA
ncbi:MAG: hypothetical protein M1830_005327 [Pleopsidium flavum]|nr:MAG: hypothetical protein M1830_005327 [Pleopsidium flavum]